MDCYKLIVVVLLSLTMNLAMGQSFTGGLKLGFDLSQIDGDKLKGYHKGGMMFGGFVNRQLNPKLNWQMEMMYISKGSKEVTKVDTVVVGFKRIAVNYIDVPILLQIWLEKLKTDFEMGVSFSTLISSKEENEDGETIIIGPFRRFGVNSIFGLNYAFGDRLSGTVRWTYSLSAIGEENKVLYTVWNRFGGSYNNVLEFSLNYHIQSGE